MAEKRTTQATRGGDGPLGWRASAGLERWIAVVRLGAAAFLLVQLVLLRPRLPVLALLGLPLLGAASAAALALHAIAPAALARLRVRVPLFAAEWAAATLALYAWDGPGDLTWMAFLFVIMSGAVRWRMRGALAGFLLFAASDLPLDILTPRYTQLTFDPASITFKLGLLGVAALFFGLQNRAAHELALTVEAQTAGLERDFRIQREASTRLRESEAQLRESEGRLRVSEAEMRVVLEASLDAIVTMDEIGIVTGWNAAAERMFGWRRDEALGLRVVETLIPPALRGQYERSLARLRRGDGTVAGHVLELSALHRDGHQLPIELALSPASRQGQRLTVVAFIRDISERRRGESLKAAQFAVTRALVESPTVLAAAPALLRGLCENLGWDAGRIWLVDSGAGLLRQCAGWRRPALDDRQSEAGQRDTFAPGEGVPGRVWASARETWLAEADGEPGTVPDAGPAGFRTAVAVPIRSGLEVTGVLEILSRDRRAPEPDTLQVLGDIGHQVGQFAERRRVEDELTQALQFQALHDPLTWLPNRTLFNDRLTQGLLRGQRESRRLALLMIDLDGFKAVNDRLGHPAGDGLLREVAARLRGAVRESDTVARLGGDEFAVVSSGVDTPEAAARTAQKLLAALGRPFAIDGRGVEISASVGVAVSPDDGLDSDALLRAADAAMYAAKRSGSGWSGVPAGTLPALHALGAGQRGRTAAR